MSACQYSYQVYMLKIFVVCIGMQIGYNVLHLAVIPLHPQVY
jgi:hypothetical protein